MTILGQVSFLAVQSVDRHPSIIADVMAVSIVIVLAAVNCLAWFAGGPAKFRTVELVSAGFLPGMFAMYIALHIDRWK